MYNRTTVYTIQGDRRYNVMTGAKTTRRGVRRCNLHHLVKKPIEKNGGNGGSILAGIGDRIGSPIVKYDPIAFVSIHKPRNRKRIVETQSDW